MTCPRCGAHGAPGSRFCHACGLELADRPGPASPSPGVVALRAVAAGGWPRAAIRGLGALAAMGAAGQAVAVLSFLAQPEGLGPAAVAALGGLFFYSFHHVAIRIEVSEIALPLGGGPAEVTFTLSAALLLATAAAGWLLFRAGRAVAAAEGGPPWARALHGAKPALPYAAVAFAFSFADRLRPPPSVAAELVAAGDVVVRPAAAWALLWPLAIGMVLGAAGGLATWRADAAPSRWARLLAGSVSGGWRMTWAAVALAVAGLVVLAAVQPQDTARYFDLVSRGPPSRSVLMVALTALLLPNAGVALAAVAMGGNVVLEVLGSACSVLSYGGFPGGLSPGPPPLGPDACSLLPVEFGVAPAGYFLFLLVPAAATLWGGWRAAERAAATTPPEGAVVGAAAGVVFAVLFVAATLVDRIAWSTEGPFAAFFGGGSSTIGPSLAPAFALALGWGALGGAGGGFARAARSRSGLEDRGEAGEPPATVKRDAGAG